MMLPRGVSCGNVVKFVWYSNNFFLYIIYLICEYILRHFQKGLRSDPEHSELKKAYFGLKNLLKKSKSVRPCLLWKFPFRFISSLFSFFLSFGC